MLTLMVRSAIDRDDTDEFDLENYWNEDDLGEALDERFPDGWEVCDVKGIDYVDVDEELSTYFLIESHLQSNEKAFRSYVDIECDAVYCANNFEEAFLGEYRDVDSWIWNHLDMLGEEIKVPEGIRVSLDYHYWYQVFTFTDEGFVFAVNP